MMELFSGLAAFVVKDVPVFCSDVPGLRLSIAVELVWQWLWLSQLLYGDVFRPAVDRKPQCYVWAPGYSRFQGNIANERGDVQVTHYVVRSRAT